MVPNCRHLFYRSKLIYIDLDFCAGTKLPTSSGGGYQIADIFSGKGTKLPTPLKLKVPNYRHLFQQRYQITDTFKAKGTKLPTPLRAVSRLFAGRGTKLPTPLTPKTAW
jgi:hypothetical protein